MQESLFNVDVWKPALERYGAVTHLTVILYDINGQIVGGPAPSSPLFAVFEKYDYDPGIFSDCAHKCVTSPTNPTVFVTPSYGLAVVSTPLVLEGAIVGAAVAGYALIDFTQSSAIQGLARQAHIPFDHLWKVAREAQPVPQRRLVVHGELLQVLGDTVLRENYRTRQYQNATARLKKEKVALQMVAEGTPLQHVMESLIRQVESESIKGALGSIVLLNEAGTHIQNAFGPSLPSAFNLAVEGIALRPPTETDWHRVFQLQPVVVSNLATDPKWEHFRKFVAPYGLRALWSTPIVGADGRALGAFTIYYPQPCDPSPEDMHLVETITRIAAIVIQRRRAEEALEFSEERYRDIFQTAAVSIWEEDFSLVKSALDDLKRRGVEDFRQYFVDHPEFVSRMIDSVRIVDVNSATVRLFGARDKSELLHSLHDIFLPETEQVFVE